MVRQRMHQIESSEIWWLSHLWMQTLNKLCFITGCVAKKANPLALSIVTWIGCGISMLGLVLTIISYLCFKYVWLSLYLIGLSFNISISLITFWFIVFAIRDVFRTLSNIYSLNIYLKCLTTTLNGTDLSNYLTLPVGDSIFTVSNIEVSQFMAYKTYGLFS